MKRSLVPYCFVALLLSAVWQSNADDDSGDSKKKDSVGTVIGIDLGTTYSWLANY